MIDYEIKKEALLKKQHFKCATCKKEFQESEKIELAHGLRNDKKNRLFYSEYVIDNILNLSATHSGNCNDACNVGKGSNPVQFQERLIDIISAVLMDDPSIFIIKRLNEAFNNIGSLVTDNVVILGQYAILENFFAHYENDV